jgi:hypothetical protein
LNLHLAGGLPPAFFSAISIRFPNSIIWISHWEVQVLLHNAKAEAIGKVAKFIEERVLMSGCGPSRQSWALIETSTIGGYPDHSPI